MFRPDCKRVNVRGLLEGQLTIREDKARNLVASNYKLFSFESTQSIHVKKYAKCNQKDNINVLLLVYLSNPNDAFQESR